MPNEEQDHCTQLVGALLLEAGRLVEDASPEFALGLPDSHEGVIARIALLEITGNNLQALAGAARALLRDAGD